jgi:hypothetical protein
MRKVRKTQDVDQSRQSVFNQIDYADIYSHDFFLGNDNGSIKEHKPWES